MKNMFHLRDFIDIDILQEIQDKFAEATGFAAVTVDFKGNPVTKYSNFSKFCKLIRKNRKCEEACQQSDAHGGLEAARTGEPYIYKCHTGLIDFAVPIIIKGNYVGAIMAGQVKVSDDKNVNLEKIVKEVPNWKNKKEVIVAYEEIVPIPYEKIIAAAHMMFLISNYIGEKGAVGLIQEELNKKNLKLMDEMKARAELEQTVKNSQIKALQSQINPHFLFNVLNTIGRLALIESASRTQEIVFLLSEMLRYTLQKSTNQLVSLGEEILHVERYLKIQSVRLGNRLEYHLNIPEDLKEIKTPFMIIQPFIENSIKHGIELKEGGGKVEVDIYSEKDNIIIQITDDGIGINEDKLNTINNNDITDTSEGIGINNVNQRLTLYFGKDYKVKVASKLGQGTIVSIKIPNYINLRRAVNV